MKSKCCIKMKYFFRYCKEFQNVWRFSIGAFPRYNVIIFLMQRKASFSEKIVKIWLLKSVRYIDDGWLVINFANAAGLYPHIIHSVGLCCVKILHNSINIGVALNTFWAPHTVHVPTWSIQNAGCARCLVKPLNCSWVSIES